VDNGLVFHTLIADGKEYELENSLTGKNNEINWQYYIKSDDVVLKDLRDTKEYKVVACYGDKDYTLDCVVDRYTLYNGTAYEFTHSTLQIGNLLIGSSEDSFTVSDKKQDFYYILSYTSTKGNVNFDSDANLFEYQEMLDNKKSLKDIFTEFAKNLQKRFGKIKGVTDKNYITNSYHVHVTENINAFDKLKFEAQFQELSPGGAISYVEVPDMNDNIPAVLSVMQFIYENIMYAELNTKSDYCQVCGYTGQIQIITDDDGKVLPKWNPYQENDRAEMVFTAQGAKSGNEKNSKLMEFLLSDRIERMK